MTNEYGVKLDSNKYAPSIFGEQSECYLCGNMEDLVRHEVFHGTANRAISKKYGCWVLLCARCHHDLHNRRPEVDWKLHRVGQIKAMEYYGWSIDDFRERFGKSWL